MNNYIDKNSINTEYKLKNYINNFSYPEFKSIENKLREYYNDNQILTIIDEYYSENIHNISEIIYNNITNENLVIDLGKTSWNLYKTDCVLLAICYALNFVLDKLCQDLEKKNILDEETEILIKSQSRVIEFWWNGIGNWMA